ncbi:hypothetical protein [Absidia glauca]|uniref:RING-CH-type domain-containing protein n=1 Tax=Absidia glauca TaxID=4829 RepID=A0A163JPT2_ABSGL|nr:hypothetical protein [Absidia glauca]
MSLALAPEPVMDMNNPSPSSSPPLSSSSSSSLPTTERRCWICFGEDTDSDGRWVKPCPCSLVSHEQCLLDWIAENQKEGISTLKKVYCPQCAHPYYLFEHHSLSLRCLELLQRVAQSTAPYLMVVGLGCSIIVAASTYGVYAVLTLFGSKEGEKMLGPTSDWTWRTFLGLPSIPVALVASRLRMADGVLPLAAVILMRANAPLSVSWPPSPALIIGSLPWFRLVYFTVYSFIRNHLSHKLAIQPPTRRSRYTRLSLYQPSATTNVMTPPYDAAREGNSSTQSSRDNQETDLLYGRNSDLNVTIMGALLWPTISSFIGNCLKYIKYVRHYFPETFHRNILGGCLYVVAKDMIVLLYRYERICQRRSRRIRSFDDDDDNGRHSSH